MQKFTSDVHWSCPRCRETNRQEVGVPELDFAVEKTSDMGTEDCIEISCDHCETTYMGHMWVYPRGTEFEIEKSLRSVVGFGPELLTVPRFGWTGLT